MMYLDWFRNRRIFLTGHTGFKGAWLSLWLAELGAELTGYALAPEPGSMFETLGLAAGMRSLAGDIRDRRHLGEALREARPEAVIHMAAQSLVRCSYDDPLETVEVNVLGTANMLDAIRGIEGLRAGLIVTSDKSYENPGDGKPLAEGAPMGGRDPYSASKGCAELVVRSFAQSFFEGGPCRVASVRAGNVIGGGDWAQDRIVPDLARAALSGEPALIRRPDAVRPWQHVLEPLSAYLLLTEALATGKAENASAWNVGPSAADAVTVRAVAERFARLWPEVRFTLATSPSGPHEAPVLAIDSEKIRQRLGWTPALDVPEAIALTAAWYRRAAEAPDEARALSVEQIGRYAALRARMAGEPAA